MTQITRRFFDVFIVAMIICCIAPMVNASELTREFLNGVQLYNDGKYEDAISAFTKITDHGVKNGNLFYNLGNAYLKNDDIGNAILWYERALNYTPHDPDLHFNYNYALTYTKDKKESAVSPVFKVLFFWKELMGQQTIIWTGLVLNLIFWMILSVQALRKKKKLISPAYIVLIFAIIFSLTAATDFYRSAFLKNAIILPAKVSVRSGLSEASTELFVLHAGSKVKIEKAKDDFYKIYFSEGKIGWLHKSSIGII